MQQCIMGMLSDPVVNILAPDDLVYDLMTGVDGEGWNCGGAVAYPWGNRGHAGMAHRMRLPYGHCRSYSRRVCRSLRQV